LKKFCKAGFTAGCVGFFRADMSAGRWWVSAERLLVEVLTMGKRCAIAFRKYDVLYLSIVVQKQC
jgi:hypothetical protein